MRRTYCTYWWIAAVLLVALGAAHCAPAQTSPPAASESPEATPAELWATMLKSQGSAYVAARDKLLQSGAASEILKAKLTDSDWRVQAVARAGLERLSRPQAYAEYDAGLAGGLRAASKFRGDLLRSVVMIFDKDFQFQSEFGIKGNKPENLIGPMHLAVDGQNRLYVSQLRNRGVNVYQLSGS